MLVFSLLGGTCCKAAESVPQRPRLYFDGAELLKLRSLRDQGIHKAIWKNMIASAEWCQQREPRGEWIPTVADDPIYENLYDRFYAAMHDMAVVEHLALTSALSDPEHDPYFDAARNWAIAVAEVWRHEANNPPDASKAYAVLRVLKGLAVAYDVLYDRLQPEDRETIRETLLAVGRPYFEFFQIPSTAGEGYNKHHGSVDASPFGIIALSLLHEVPEVEAWLELAVEKHVDYLLPHALTPSGTSEQTSNFWASTLQYRIFFLEPLRRVTGRDLLKEFPDALPGRIALAAVAAGQAEEVRFNQANHSVLFGPSYGQIDYWSPVLLYLARHHREPTYQYLAMGDKSLGSLQRTRYVTPTRGEELLFCLGPYSYLWFDPSVADSVSDELPRSFIFPEPEVNEVYVRSSYEAGGVVVGMKKGGLIVHAGGRPVLVDQLPVDDINNPSDPMEGTTLEDSGGVAVIRCTGPAGAGLGQQKIELQRPDQLTIERHASQPLTWWYGGEASRDGNRWQWPDGTQLEVQHGEVVSVDPEGFVETKIHYGGMKYADPHPFTYPTITVAPVEGRIMIVVKHAAHDPSN